MHLNSRKVAGRLRVCYTPGMEKIYYYNSSSTDPTWNLALEEYVLLNFRDKKIFMLWQNDKTVVIGKNQIAENEVDLKYAQDNEISVVRRTTGGGAVYHDMGNVNYSFFMDYNPLKPVSLSDCAVPIAKALNVMGAEASFSGRNDILCRGRKVCGTAERIDGNRILAHGCILFSVDLETMTRVLTPPAEKLAKRGINSVRSRVMNLKECFPDMNITDFKHTLAAGVLDGYNVEKLDFSFEDLRGIMKLQKKYEMLPVS